MDLVVGYLPCGETKAKGVVRHLPSKPVRTGDSKHAGHHQWEPEQASGLAPWDFSRLLVLRVLLRIRGLAFRFLLVLTLRLPRVS
jgi:hypothetical protein